MGKIITKSSLEIQQRLTNCIGSEQVLCQDAFKSPNLYPSLSPAPIIIIIIIVLFFFFELDHFNTEFHRRKQLEAFFSISLICSASVYRKMHEILPDIAKDPFQK